MSNEDGLTDEQWARQLFECENCEECGQDETGHTVGPDPLGLRHAWCQHYHVQRHGEDDDIFRTFDLGAAFDYAATELDLITDSEHSMIGALGEAGEFEDAFRCWQHVETWSTLVLNARNMYKQHTVPAAERAPLYQGDDPDTLAKRRIAADHTMEQVSRDGPDGFLMWACVNVECAPTDDTDDE